MRHELLKSAKARTRIKRAAVVTKASTAEDPDYIEVELRKQLEAPEWEQLTILELAEIEDDDAET